MFKINYSLIFLLLFCLLSRATQKNVYIIDCCFSNMNLTRGVWGKTYDAVKRLGYELKWVGSAKNIQNCHCIICFKLSSRDLILLKKHPKEKRILFLWEPPVVRPNEYKKKYHDQFGKIYTWSDNLIDNNKYFKFSYPMGFLPIVESGISFEDKKLFAMINCDKDSLHELSLYQERRNIIEFFEKKYSSDFDLYGYGWSSRGYKNYKGTVKSKIECLKKYRFCFAYENTKDVDGYITEKIFDAMFAGTVPIYLGAGNITNYIPKNCFIDRRDFESNEDIYNFLKNMKTEEHELYLNNIKLYLDSDQRYLVSWELMIDSILSAVEPGYDRKNILNKEDFDIVNKVYKELLC